MPAVVIGRSPDADVIIDDASISRKHARLQLGGGGDAMLLEDLGSSNGSILDGVPLKNASAPVRLGSCFELGGTTIVLQRALTFFGRDERDRETTAEDSIVRDPAMQRLYGLVRVIGPSPLSVLIHGETGVGKELLAQALHRASPRANARLVVLNCAALPDTLLESELFGFERGAFTGANQPKEGLFEAADRGTIFLDEIGEMPAATQAKLLRVLESGEVMRLGSTKMRKVDVRVISATNRDLRSLTLDKKFRSDLFYRISGSTMHIPPLRKRIVEIVPLAELFASRMAKRTNRPTPALDDSARAALEAHDWPGNVRELRNAIEHATVVAAQTISAADLGLNPAISQKAEGLDQRLEDLERANIIDALERAHGNQSEAARLLGISRGKLLKRIAAYGLGKPKSH